MFLTPHLMISCHQHCSCKLTMLHITSTSRMENISLSSLDFKTFVTFYVCTYMVHSISFQVFFVQAFKIVVDSWKFSILLLYTLWDNWPIFMISGSNEQLQQQLEYTLLKPDCHSWWISKMQSGREDTLEEWYVNKFCFKFGKNATETYGMLQTTFGASGMNRALVFECHKRFKEGTESVRDDERCGRSKEVNTPGLIGQRVRVTILRFKGVQEEIPLEEASTLQIESVAFPPGQCTSS